MARTTSKADPEKRRFCTHSAEGGNMTAAILKRKLRNFPTGNLTLRIVGS